MRSLPFLRSWPIGLAVLAAFTLHSALYRAFSVDDAYITFRYVRQWTHGHGLVFNLGERVEGYSNFLWIALLAPFDRQGVDLMLAAKGLGWLLGLGLLAVIWFWSRRLPGWPAAPLILALSGPMAAWSMGGLEAPLFALLLAAAGYAYVREEECGTGWLSGPLFGLLALTRPEGLMFAAVAGGLRAWQLWRTRARLQRHDWLRLGSLGLVFGAYFLWRLGYYGYPLPNTVYAKSLGLHPRAWLEGAYYLYQNLRHTGLLLAGLGVILAIRQPRRPLTINFALANLAAYGAFVLISGGDWMPMQRFLVHVLPLAALVMQYGLGTLAQAFPARRTGLALALLALQLAWLGAASLEARFLDGVGDGPVLAEDRALVRHLRAEVRPGDVVAVVDAGYIAYRLPLETRVVDMVGLTDAHIAHRPVQLPGGLFGRSDAFGKWDIDYVFDQQPRFIQVNLIEAQPEAVWQTNFTGTTLLVNDPRFRANYRPLNGPGLAGLFERVP